MIEVGNMYRFDTHGEDDDWKMFDGKECTVLHPLNKKRTDDAPSRVWAVRFDNERRTEIYARDHELFGPFKQKIVLISAGTGATLIADLPYGEPTDSGDRTSRYIEIATVMGRKKFVKAALIEEKAGLPETEWGYRLRVLNDVDETDGFFLATEHLDEEELADLLDHLSYDLEHGRM